MTTAVPLAVFLSLSVFSFMMHRLRAGTEDDSLLIGMINLTLFLKEFGSQNLQRFLTSNFEVQYLGVIAAVSLPLLTSSLMIRIVNQEVKSKFLHYLEIFSYINFAVALISGVILLAFAPGQHIQSVVLLASFNGFLFFVLFMPYAIFRSINDNHQYSLFYLAGIFCLGFATVSDFIIAKSVPGWPWFTPWASMVMSIILAKVNSLKHVRSYHEVLNLYNEVTQKEKSRNHLLQELKKLVFDHQVREISKGVKLEQTMPSGVSTACAICFDIQNSSQIDHQNRHLFFQDVLKACNAIAMAKHGKSPYARRAHIVKEMGDGFLATVGHPFSSESDIYQSSYKLALDFINSFQEVVDQYFIRDKPKVSISIAVGSVRTWYARTGLRNYEMYGDALVKATRYESFRKTLLERNESLRGSHILVVQKDVFEELPVELRSDLIEYELDGFVIRNDSSKKIVYYRSEFDHGAANYLKKSS